MQPNHVPSIGKKYWAALILASVFGANTGDFLSDVLGLGHIAGLPYLAALFAIVVIVVLFFYGRADPCCWNRSWRLYGETAQPSVEHSDFRDRVRCLPLVF